jgi:hypothetical protein
LKVTSPFTPLQFTLAESLHILCVNRVAAVIPRAGFPGYGFAPREAKYDRG